MQIVASRSAPLTELLAELGAKDPPRAAELVRRHNGIQGSRVTAGAVLEIPDEVASALVHSKPIEGATPMKTLGIHAVSALLDAAGAEGDPQGLGRLLALAAIHLPDLVPSNVESGKLSITLPLAPGKFRLPLASDHALEIDVPRRTSVDVEFELIPTPDGPKIGSAKIECRPPLRISNPADFSFFRKSPFAFLANAILNVSLERMEIARDGAVTLGTQLSGHSLTVPSALLPNMELDAKRLLDGKVVRDGSPLMSLPDRIDPTALLGAMGGMAEQGSFALTLHGKQGVIDVGEAGIRIRGKSSPVVAQISGDFDIDERGRIQLRFDARTNVDQVDAHVKGSAELEVREGEIAGSAQIEGRARPTRPIEIEMPIQIAVDQEKVGAKIGHLEVAHDRKRMHVRSGRRWFGIERSAERKALLALGGTTSVTLKEDALISGDLRFRLTERGVELDSNGIHAVFDLSGAQIDNEALAIRLAEGSALEGSISRISLDEQGRLRLDDLTAGFQIRIEAGRFDHGLLSAALDSGEVNHLAGTIVLSRDERGASIDGQAEITVHALPKAARLLNLGVEKTGTMRARITRDGVELAPSKDDVSLYRGTRSK